MTTPMKTSVNSSFLHSELTDRIIAAFFEVYDKLGFGFLESNYKRALEIVLNRNGLSVQREVPVDVVFDGESIGHYRMDLVVNDLVIVEVKSTQAINVSDERQTLNYLRATKYEVGLLLHFGPSPKIRRFAYLNQAPAKATSNH